MPTYNNISVTPGTGQNDAVLVVSGLTENTGRENRTATFYATGDVRSTNNLTVTQLSIGPFIQITSQSIGATTTSATCTGTSNLETLKLTGSLAAKLSSASINNVNLDQAQRALLVGNGFSPAGDPGKTSEYNITLVFAFDVNQGAKQTFNGTIGDSDTSKPFSVEQAAAAETVSLVFASTRATDAGIGGNISVTLNAAGTAYQDGLARTLSIDASSSTLNWTISSTSEGDSGESE